MGGRVRESLITSSWHTNDGNDGSASLPTTLCCPVHSLLGTNFSENDFKSDSYFRVKYLNYLLEKGTLDTNLRCVN